MTGISKYKLVFLGASRAVPVAAFLPPPAAQPWPHPRACGHLLPGDQSVGKTSMISRFINDSFETHYQVRMPGMAGS